MESDNVFSNFYENNSSYSEFFEIEDNNKSNFEFFNEENYFEILNSLKNKEQDDVIRQSDAEEDDIDLEQEMQQINEEFSQVIGEDSKNKLTSCILMDIVNGKFQTCGADYTCRQNY
ncbi:hypothetical protein Glove_75g70 [Diversispora epigaea]|uniref:Uncharacterized protein n=1 Tax=Diversispora epigaea TaxID=1348612 RepID=A0A397JD93_9GLOM|nr:hypothetical protein Glove_75g70 [Diversispora epigaea]